MAKLIPLMSLLLCWISVKAQTETNIITPLRNDSLSVMQDSLSGHISSQSPVLQPQISTLDNEPLINDSIPSPAASLNDSYYDNSILMPTTLQTPLRWHNIQVNGFLGQSYYPGLMNIYSGSLGLQYHNNHLSAYFGGVINKYAYYRGLHTQTGITANLSYHFSPKWSATVFGTYYWGNMASMANGAPMSPAMLGFYNVNRFGGYIDYRISENFGIQTGAQLVQQVGPRPHYQLQPIVTPYIKIGVVEIGLPVGQILHGIIQNSSRRSPIPK